MLGAVLILAAPPLGLPLQAQTAGSGPLIAGIADSPNAAPGPIASGIAEAPSQPGATASGIADTAAQPVAPVSGIADAPYQPAGTASGIAAPGVPQPEQYQGPSHGPAAGAKTPPVVRPAGPAPVQGPARGRYVAPRYAPGRAPSRGVTAAPQVAARGPVAQAPRLPNTGTGGLLEPAAQSGVAPWMPALLLLSVLALLGPAAYAMRRAR